MLASADNPLGAIPRFNHPKEDFQTVRDVSVIFPAFNEEGNIRCTVETVIRGRPHAAARWEETFLGGGGKIRRAHRPTPATTQTPLPSSSCIKKKTQNN